MAVQRQVIRSVVAGLCVAAFLGWSISAKIDAAHPGGTRRATDPFVSAARGSEHAFTDYDLSADEDFLVSATPGYLAGTRSVSRGNDDRGDRAGTGGSNAPGPFRHGPLGDTPAESLTPAEVAMDNAPFATGGNRLAEVPVDLALAPGTNYPAVGRVESFDDYGRTNLFDPVGISGQRNPFEVDSGDGYFDSTRTMTPVPDPADHLFATSTAPELSASATLWHHAAAR